MPEGCLWRNPACDLDGGLGAPIEQRTVGTLMVCENGHKWIAYFKTSHVGTSLKYLALQGGEA